MKKLLKRFALLAVVLAVFVSSACSASNSYNLAYFDGIADDGSYNTDLFYRNDLLLNHAADPGCIWVSEE